MTDYDPNQVDRTLEDVATEAQIARANELADLRQVLATREGRKFLWRQLSMLGIYRTPFVVGAADQTAFNLGAHNHGLWLMAEILAAGPEFYVVMQKENQK